MITSVVLQALRSSIAAVVSVAVLAPLSCSPTQGPLVLSNEWPTEPQSLPAATRTWTRVDEYRAGLSQDAELIVRLSATFRSPAWRAAYVNHLGKIGQLSPTQIAKLRAAQEKAGAKYHEFALLVATHDRRINDLAKGDRSVWRMVLIDSNGNDVAPLEVFKDRRPPAEIRAELPHLTAFDEVYIARFPANHPILAAGSKSFSLKLWSGRGGVTAVWTDSHQ